MTSITDIQRDKAGITVVLALSNPSQDGRDVTIKIPLNHN